MKDHTKEVRLVLATLEVQKAIYETLTIFGLPTYSTLPVNTKLPYVQFTGIQIIDRGNKSHDRQTYIVSLSAWCKDDTSITIHEMVRDILEILDEELYLGEQFSHDCTKLEFLSITQDELNTEFINRAMIDLRIDVSEN